MNTPFKRKKPACYYEMMYLKGIVEELEGYLKTFESGGDLTPGETAHFHLLVSEISRLLPPHTPAVYILETLDLLLGIKNGDRLF